MATRTFSDQLAQPRSLPNVGVIGTRAVYSGTALGTLTASDVLLAAKIPTGHYLLDAYLQGHVDNDAIILKLGIAGDATLIASETFSATALLFRATGTIPQLVSLSDDANPQYSWATVTVNSGGTDTGTASLEFVMLTLSK